MSKTKAKWIIGVGSTPGGYNLPDALTADNVWYDATTTIKDAIIEGAGSIGVTGPQGATGLYGGPAGVTGLQGAQGTTGIRGVTGFGIQGSQGIQGPQGDTGISPISLFPSSYITISTPVDATNSDWQNVLTTQINLDSTVVLSPIFATFSFETESVGAGSYPTGEYRVVVDTTSIDGTGQGLQKFLLPDDVAIGTVTLRTNGLVATLYNITGQVRKVSGQQTVRVNKAQLFAQSFIGGKGDYGPAGATGLGPAGETGIQGETGIRGPYGNTGIGGPTGIQGHTGLGEQGYTGVQGPTGLSLQGITGLQGLVKAIALPSNFLTLDTTSQLVDNTSFSNIVGLSDMTVIVDASGSYIYSTLTLETDSTGNDSTQSYVSGAMRIVIEDSSGIEFSRFVQNNDDLEVDTITLRAGPFADGTYSVSGQIRKDSTEGFGERHFQIRKGHLYAQALQGGQGPQGDPGAVGFTGLQGHTGLGVQGYTGVGQTGIQGVTGVRGHTGLAGPAGLTGAEGLPGITGFQGITGVGFQGSTGIYGLTGFGGITGVRGITGVIGVQGITGTPGYGATGIQGIQGSTGIKGVTGISTQAIYNPVSRYSAYSDSSSREVWVVSASTALTGLTWTRSGTDMTISRASHGHIAGNRVIVRNTNQDYLNATIDSTTANSFVVTTTNSGSASGYDGAYSLGFTYDHAGYPTTGGTLTAPEGNPADVQLLAMRIRTGSRATSTYSLIVPASAVNGAGDNTSLSNCYMPDFNIRQDSDALSAVAATVRTGSYTAGSYSTFEFGNLGGPGDPASRFIILHF